MLLHKVSTSGLDALDLNRLKRLQILVEKRDYSSSKKGQKSKLRLLAKINAAIYERTEGKGGLS